MEMYLAVITTILVLTQVIRVTQNHISIMRQRREIDKTLSWIKENDISENDFQTQRETFVLLNRYLKRIESDRDDGK